jgi:hypothetical protein
MRIDYREGTETERPVLPHSEWLDLLSGFLSPTRTRYRQARQTISSCSKPAAALPRQNTLAQIRQNRLLVYPQLYRALGGGWASTDAQWLGQGEATTK